MRSGRAALDARPARGARRRQGRLLAVLLAVGVGAGGALGLLAVVEPAMLTAATAPAAGPAAGAVPSTEAVVTAPVIASSSCREPGAQDVVAVPLAAGPVPVPLEGCGATVGSTVTVRVLLTGAAGAGDPLASATGTDGVARLLGAGSAAPLATGEAPSPMTGRITVTLTVVAGIATAGLLLALTRQRSTRTTPDPTRGAGGVAASARGSRERDADGVARSARGTTRSRRAPRAPHTVAGRARRGAPAPSRRRPAPPGSRR